MHRLHVGLHDVQKGPGFGGPLRKARAWALNQEGESRVGRHREHPGQPVPLEGTVAPEKFFSALPRTPALGRGGQACSPASPPTPAREETGRASAGGSRSLLRHQGGEAAGSRAPGPSGATPSRHFPLKRFGEKRGGLGSIGGAKGSPHGKRKISKIALVVQPKVNSSISPAADRSNGQETTAENKAPRCLQGQTRLARTEQCCAFWKGRRERFPPLLPPPPPFLSVEQVRREKERREEAKGARGERSGSLKARV